MMIAKIEMTINEEKKHSVRYDASKNQNDPAITSVYVMKSSLTKPYPDKIFVTIDKE